MTDTSWHKTWVVPADHPAFAGHFPGNPIVPGVVLLDHALQLLSTAVNQPAPHIKLSSAKFLSPVAPGETVSFNLQAKTAASYQVSITANDRLAAKADFTLMDLSAT